jgi:DNA-directed RNA polymerase III subunit RPC6
LQILDKAGSNGMTMNELKKTTNLVTPAIQNCLKELKEQVKAFTHPKRRRIYLLSKYEPSDEITGGVFYSEGKPDLEFIDLLQKFCLDLVAKSGSSPPDAISICEQINATNKFTVQLQVGDIDRVLNCLVYDGKLEKMDGPNDGIVYRVAHQYLEPAFIEIPCATCPIFHRCKEGSEISPSTCEYLNKWLTF